MGSNDHQPVPDPKPRVQVPLKPNPGLKDSFLAPPRATPEPPDEVDAMARAKTDPGCKVGGPTTDSERLHALEARSDILEASRGSYDIQVVSLLEHILRQSKAITEMRSLLRQTIRGVERLAQGHSKGNLGLPSEEDWEAGGA